MRIPCSKMYYVKTYFCFSYIIFCSSRTILPYNTIERVEDIPSILMMYCYSAIPVVYP